MKKIWTVIPAAVIVVAMGLVVGLTEINAVIWSPGTAVNVVDVEDADPVIQIEGGTDVPSGQILATAMTQSAPDATVTLRGVIMGYFMPNRDVVPRDAVYSSGQSASDVADARRTAIESSRDQALAAAVGQAGMDVLERPKVQSIRPNGPAFGILQPGDFIVSIDNRPMSAPSDVVTYIRSKKVGDQVVLKILRDGAPLTLTIAQLAGSSTNNTIPTMGAPVGTGYSYAPEIRIGTDVDQGDPAQSLALALGTYELLTNRDDTAGQILAATGVVAPDGTVSSVSGINEHALSAWSSGAVVLFISSDNCSDITLSRFPGMAVVPVTSLDEAVTALRDYAGGSTTLPSC